MEADPNVSVRGLSREFGMARMMRRRLVKEDLGLKSLAKVKCQQLTAPQRLKRETMCKKMLNMMKREVKGKVLVFLDEKDFHLTKHHNCCNDHTLAPNTKSVSPANRFIGRAKFPKKAMFFGYVGSDGKAFLGIWLKGTLNGVKYKSILTKHVIPTLNSTYSTRNYIWTQDGASSHTANSILKYLDGRLGSRGYWSKGICLPNSCNLNPLDFSVWSCVDSKANNVYHKSVDDMKAAVSREWEAMDSNYVKVTCSRFRSKLEACIAAGGGVFEKV